MLNILGDVFQRAPPARKWGHFLLLLVSGISFVSICREHDPAMLRLPAWIIA